MSASMLDDFCTDQLTATARECLGHIVSVGRPRHELYAFFRNFSNLPRFMRNVRSVTMIDALRSQWVMPGPGNTDLYSEVIIIEDDPGRLIAWTSTDGSAMRHSGRVEFRDSLLGPGTELAVTILYDPPAGMGTHPLKRRLQREQYGETKADLCRFRDLVETLRGPLA